MSALTSEEAKQAITHAVGEIEKQTSAEIVVALRARSGDYRRADLSFGAISALFILCVFLYHPDPFEFTVFPLEQAACFVMGSVACAYLAPLRRLLTPRRVRTENVARSARSMFVECGVDRTTGRMGILVYVSTFERDVFLVLDRGIDTTTLATEIERAETALRAAVREGQLDRFHTALADFGEALAKAHPVSDDDVDELSNEVAA